MALYYLLPRGERLTSHAENLIFIFDIHKKSSSRSHATYES